MIVDKYKFVLYWFLATFWVACCNGFVVDEFLPMLKPHKGSITLLCEMSMFALGTLTVRRRGDVFFYAGFLLLAFFCTCVANTNSISRFLIGLRDFSGLLCVVPAIHWLASHKPASGPGLWELFRRQLWIWLVLQAVCVTWQWLRYGACDEVGGSAGSGFSGQVSMCIYIVSFFLMMPTWDSTRLWQSFKANRRYFLLLYPTFLNETKISFVYLAIFLFLLMHFDRKFVVRLVVSLPLIAGVFVGLGYIYESVTHLSITRMFTGQFYMDYLMGENLERQIDAAQDILDGTADDFIMEFYNGDVDIPRIAKILLIWPNLADTGGGIELGAGISQFQGWSSNNMTSFARYNEWVLYGSKPWAFWMMVQMGVIGLIFSCVILLRNLLARARGDGGIARINWFMVAIFAIILVYNSCWHDMWVCVIMFFIGQYNQYTSARRNAAS